MNVDSLVGVEIGFAEGDALSRQLVGGGAFGLQYLDMEYDIGLGFSRLRAERARERKERCQRQSRCARANRFLSIKGCTFSPMQRDSVGMLIAPLVLLYKRSQTADCPRNPEDMFAEHTHCDGLPYTVLQNFL